MLKIGRDQVIRFVKDNCNNGDLLAISSRDSKLNDYWILETIYTFICIIIGIGLQHMKQLEKVLS